MSKLDLVKRYLEYRNIEYVFYGKLVRVDRHIYDHTFINKCGYHIGRMK